MKIIVVGKMPNGTKIQIEDWYEDVNSYARKSTLGAYPISQINMKNKYAPKRNETFRATFNFGDEAETRQAFEDLKAGTKKLINFKDHIHYPEMIECI